MIDPLDTRAGDLLLATGGSGGSGVNWELILLVSIVSVVILGVAWLVLKGSGGGAD